jgi:predicted nucleic acid-binding protein
VILADTTMWIDLWRGGNQEMQRQLVNEQIAMHPLIIAELALGSLRDRHKTLAALEGVTQVQVARLSEVRRMIEAHSLYSKGIGLTDAHLIASCLITQATKLWTRDARLRAVAEALGIHANLP